ncbi:hypothetical protein BQ1740_1092 [Bacillus subtilis]|nr:hypothetical protein BQ1740_1092 [Bacillus subtilis]
MLLHKDCYKNFLKRSEAVRKQAFDIAWIMRVRIEESMKNRVAFIFFIT